MNRSAWKLFMETKGGLNRSRIVHLLNTIPCNANKISEKLDLNYMTVRHHLKLLKGNKVIECDDDVKYGAIYYISDNFDIELFEKVYGHSKNVCDLNSEDNMDKIKGQAIKIIKK